MRKSKDFNMNYTAFVGKPSFGTLSVSQLHVYTIL